MKGEEEMNENIVTESNETWLKNAKDALENATDNEWSLVEEFWGLIREKKRMR